MPNTLQTVTPGQRVPSCTDKGQTCQDSVHRRLEHIVAPHVDSFDYFLEEGVGMAVEDILPLMVKLTKNRNGAGTAEEVGNDDDSTSDSEDKAPVVEKDDTEINISISFEDLRIAKPRRKNASSSWSGGGASSGDLSPASAANTSSSSGNSGNNSSGAPFLTPREARESGTSYSGAMDIGISIQVNGQDAISHRLRLGDMPIMVGSSKCHLKHLKSAQLIALKEEANEKGGYFVCNGIERCVRLLQVPRRNHPMAIDRNSYKNRGAAYSSKGIQMRCVRADQSAVTITMHYLNNGGATMKFTLRKQEFLLPVVVVAKAISFISDREMFERIVQGDSGNTFLTTRLEVLLRDAKQYPVKSSAHARAWLGSLFRNYLPITTDISDEDAGKMLIAKYFFVHCESFGDKLEVLLLMLRKMFSFAQGRCASDNADALQNHEILLPGHLMTMMLKEKLEEVLVATKMQMVRDYNINSKRTVAELKSNPLKFCLRHLERTSVSTGTKIATFLNTGNVISSTGLDLMQVSGYTIVAERLNVLRYMAHFQSVHRGQFFTTMKTTAVRKLLPESWGFMCPVHTPDGGPCGLLNHLARECVILSYPSASRMPSTPSGVLDAPCPLDATTPAAAAAAAATGKSKSSFLKGSELTKLLVSIGMIPAGTGAGDGQAILSKDTIPICLDGRVLGGVRVPPAGSASAYGTPDEFVRKLRVLKASGGMGQWETYIDPTMEIAYFPVPSNTAHAGVHPYAGIYMFTAPGRMIRPVVNLHTSTVEWIGPMEQPYMEIACLSDDVRPADLITGVGATTHMEIDPTFMLSHVAALTPFSDQNQSPRNMYQCQMGKQTMGTPAHAMRHRSDNKLYQIQNPQAPLVQTKVHGEYCMDEYPQGTNAVVAVVAYTGYDMEDAMIINRSAFQRGFGHGSMYKTLVVDLDEEEKRTVSSGARPALIFANVKTPPVPIVSAGDDIDGVTGEQTTRSMAGEKFCEELDSDGLPHEGTLVQYGEPVCCIVDTISGEHRFIKHKTEEKCYVSVVRVLGSGAKACARRVSITFRYPRKPVIGDKFSSRHGQKGTLSVLWPQENMPFSESGMSPDVLINPHAFPSRMTIGMLLESMAGKAGAMQGHFQNASPFQFHEENRVVDYVGEQLLKSGYNYYGSEPLYSGISGKLMQCDIFIGVVYYQRLRHMVSDKSQVRSTGAVQQVTRQPVKGRKKGGGIRLGEMERDALLSHGVSYVLHDRLMGCSDSHLAHVCTQCGGLISVSAMGANSYSRNGNAAAGAASAATGAAAAPATPGNRWAQFCKTCQSASAVKPVMLPYVYRYLTNELAGMGVKLTLTMSE